MDDSNSHRNHQHQTLTKPDSFNNTITTTTAASSAAGNKDHFHGGFCIDGTGQEDDEGNEEGDTEVWDTFTDSFRQVQSVLDQNRALIQQVNENHQSKIHDNLVKNVALIQEINGNISKVVSLYSDLSTNFSTLFHQRSPSVDAENNNSKGDSMQA